MSRVSKSITLPQEIWDLMEERVKLSPFSSKGRLIEHYINSDATEKIAFLEAQLAEQKREKGELMEILKRLSGAAPATAAVEPLPIPVPVPKLVKKEIPKLDELDQAISGMLL